MSADNRRAALAFACRRAHEGVGAGKIVEMAEAFLVFLDGPADDQRVDEVLGWVEQWAEKQPDNGVIFVEREGGRVSMGINISTDERCLVTVSSRPFADILLAQYEYEEERRELIAAVRHELDIAEAAL